MFYGAVGLIFQEKSEIIIDYSLYHSPLFPISVLFYNCTSESTFKALFLVGVCVDLGLVFKKAGKNMVDR